MGNWDDIQINNGICGPLMLQGSTYMYKLIACGASVTASVGMKHGKNIRIVSVRIGVGTAMIS
jgi:hypothetical protein